MIAGISKAQYDIIRNILKKYSVDYDFFFYGSRVNGKFENTSDLDILIVGNVEMPYEIFRGIKDEFDGSNLPFIVNFADKNKIDDNFYNGISSSLVEVFSL